MSIVKQLIRHLRILLFAFMLAVCMVLGIAPIIPKRKDEIAIEIKMKETAPAEKSTVIVK
jgi:hypothetical protein